MSFYSICMNTVVGLGERSANVPFKLSGLYFLLFKPLEFFDEVELKFWAKPRTELESYVLVGEGSSVAPSFCEQTYAISELRPQLRRHGESVQSSLLSNSLEFGGVKIRVVDALPYSYEFYSIFISQPGFEAIHLTRDNKHTLLKVYWTW
ncbi:hypothetical protein CCP4SC76_1290001 [Gammaproteobacteria bacterium]